MRSDERLSISRDATRCGWGIPVPGDSKQTVILTLQLWYNKKNVQNLDLCLVRRFNQLFNCMWLSL